MAKPYSFYAAQTPSDPIISGRSEVASITELATPNTSGAVPTNRTTESRLPTLGTYLFESSTQLMPNFTTGKPGSRDCLHTPTSLATGHEMLPQRETMIPPSSNEASALLGCAIDQMKMLLNDILYVHRIVRECNEASGMYGLHDTSSRTNPGAVDGSVMESKSSDSLDPSNEFSVSVIFFEKFMRERKEEMERREAHILPLIELTNKRIWELLEDTDDSATKRAAINICEHAKVITESVKRYKSHTLKSTGIKRGPEKLSGSVLEDLTKHGTWSQNDYLKEASIRSTPIHHQQCSESNMLHPASPSPIPITTTKPNPVDVALHSVDVNSGAKHKVYTESAGLISQQMNMFNVPFYSGSPQQKSVYYQSQLYPTKNTPFKTDVQPGTQQMAWTKSVQHESPRTKDTPFKTDVDPGTQQVAWTKSGQHESPELDRSSRTPFPTALDYCQSIAPDLARTEHYLDMNIPKELVNTTELGPLCHFGIRDSSVSNANVGGSTKSPVDFTDWICSNEYDPPSLFALPTREPVLPKDLEKRIYHSTCDTDVETENRMSRDNTDTQDENQNPNSTIDMETLRSLLTSCSQQFGVDQMADDTQNPDPELLFPIKPPPGQLPYYGRESFKNWGLLYSNLLQCENGHTSSQNQGGGRFNDSLIDEATGESSVIEGPVDDALQHEISQLLNYLKGPEYALRGSGRHQDFVDNQSCSISFGTTAQRDHEGLGEASTSLADQLQKVLLNSAWKGTDVEVCDAASTEAICRSGTRMFRESNICTQQNTLPAVAYDNNNPRSVSHKQSVQKSAIETVWQRRQFDFLQDNTNNNQDYECQRTITRNSSRSYKSVREYSSARTNKLLQGGIHTASASHHVQSDSSRRMHQNNVSPFFPWNTNLNQPNQPTDGPSLDQFLTTQSSSMGLSQSRSELNNRENLQGVPNLHPRESTRNSNF